jgi:DNA-binding FadR family transcriptional regulator
MGERRQGAWAEIVWAELGAIFRAILATLALWDDASCMTARRLVMCDAGPILTRRALRSFNLTQSIVHNLGIAIVTKQYCAGAAFPVESELCKHYGVSRSVLREAVKMLTAKGLLGARPRQGTFVQPEGRWNLLDPDVLHWLLERSFSLSLLVEFTQIRLAIEPQAAALAAKTGSADQKAAVQFALERMIAASRGRDDPLESDIAFHVAILAASNNRFYQQLEEMVRTALRFSIRRTNAYKGVALASIEDHGNVAKAILSGDATESAHQMQLLIQETLNLMGRQERGEEQRGEAEQIDADMAALK